MSNDLPFRDSHSPEKLIDQALQRLRQISDYYQQIEHILPVGVVNTTREIYTTNRERP